MSKLLHAAMEQSCQAAASILRSGGDSKDAAIQATIVLEVTCCFETTYLHAKASAFLCIYLDMFRWEEI